MAGLLLLSRHALHPLVGGLHERAEDPQDRQEEPEEEQPPCPFRSVVRPSQKKRMIERKAKAPPIPHHMAGLLFGCRADLPGVVGTSAPFPSRERKPEAVAVRPIRPS